MSEPKKRVLIVQGHPWGMTTASDVDGLILRVKEDLEKHKDVEVRVVKTTEEARSMCQDSAHNTRPSSVIFMSRSMIREAEELAKVLNPSDRGNCIRIILITGLIPNNRVCYLEKGSMPPEYLRSLIG